MGGKQFGPPVVMGDESIMVRYAFHPRASLGLRLTHVQCSPLLMIYTQAPKANGTSATPVQAKLRWNCDTKLAENICNHNRHYAENSGYFEKQAEFMTQTKTKQPIEFYDSNTGKLLFTAPKARSMEEFMVESKAHGWYVYVRRHD